MKENYQRFLTLVCLILFFCYLLFHYSFVLKEVLDYTTLFLQKVFPSSFLFLLFSSLLMDYSLSSYFHSSKSYFFILSLLSGFPSGSLIIKNSFQRKEISLNEANQMIQFSHFPNPFFIFYNVSAVLSSKKLAYLFFGILVLSNYLIFLFFPKRRIQSTITIEKKDFPNTFISSLYKTIHVLIIIYGTSIFFYLLSLIGRRFFIIHPFLYVLWNGVFDLTSGIYSSVILSNTFYQGILLFLFISFGSIPIHMQVKSILSDTPISYKSFIKGRIVSFLLCLLSWCIYSCCTVWI